MGFGAADYALVFWLYMCGEVWLEFLDADVWEQCDPRSYPEGEEFCVRAFLEGRDHPIAGSTFDNRDRVKFIRCSRSAILHAQNCTILYKTVSVTRWNSIEG